MSLTDTLHPPAALATEEQIHHVKAFALSERISVPDSALLAVVRRARDWLARVKVMDSDAQRTAEYVIPPDRWKWFGYAGHFIAADSCRFRMCTQVGGWLISSVGDMLDSKGKRQRIGAGDDAYFETFVFKAGPICSVPGCGCGQPTIDGHELDGSRCGTGGEAQVLHMAFCEKYARGGTPRQGGVKS